MRPDQINEPKPPELAGGQVFKSALEEPTGFLERSFIRYEFLPSTHHPLYQREMIDENNPFSHLNQAPNSDPTFFDRLEDTWEIMLGDHFDMNLQGFGRKGIVDIFIFPLISRILLYQLAKLVTDETAMETFIIGLVNAFTVGVLVTVSAPLEFLRAICAATLTLCASPFVLLVHIASKATQACSSFCGSQHVIFPAQNQNGNLNHLGHVPNNHI